jgi:hypothetical protein
MDLLNKDVQMSLLLVIKTYQTGTSRDEIKKFFHQTHQIYTASTPAYRHDPLQKNDFARDLISTTLNNVIHIMQKALMRHDKAIDQRLATLVNGAIVGQSESSMHER